MMDCVMMPSISMMVYIIDNNEYSKGEAREYLKSQGFTEAEAIEYRDSLRYSKTARIELAMHKSRKEEQRYVPGMTLDRLYG